MQDYNGNYSGNNSHPNFYKYEEELQHMHEQQKKLEKQKKQMRYRKRKRKMAVLLFVLTIITIFLTVIMVNSIINSRANQTSMSFVNDGVLYRTLDTSALLMRDEVVKHADADGFVYPLLPEGERVAYGQKLALISDEEVNDVQNELNDVLKKISIRQFELISLGQGSEVLELYNKMDNSLREIVKSLALSAATGNLRNAKAEELQIRGLLEERNQAIKNFEFNDPILQELNTARKGLEDKLAKKSRVFIADRTGIVSYSMDGLIDKINANNMDNISGELLAESFKSKNGFFDTVGSQKNGDGILRIVNTVYQYFVIYVPDEEMNYFTDNSIYIYLPDEKLELPNCLITNKLQADKGFYIFAKTDKYVERLVRERRLNIQIRIDSKKGIIVPLSSLKFSENNEIAELVVVQDGLAHIINVRVDIKSGDKAVVTPLDEDSSLVSGSLVVQNPRGIKEGDKLE